MNEETEVRSTGNGHYEDYELSPFDDLKLATDYDTDLDAVRAEALSLGINLSTGQHQNAIARARSRARDLTVQNTLHAPPKWFKTLERFIVSVGNALVLALMLVLSYVLPPVAVVGLGYAEVQRVALGVALFDAPRAYLMSITSVSAYLGLLVVRASMTRQQQHTHYRWSLRLVFQQLGYALGLGRWTPAAQTDAQSLDRAITRLGWLIISLGTVGTLETELLSFNGVWYRALYNIAATADLVTFLALIGGCMLTAGLLAAMHFLVTFTHGKYVTLLPDAADFFDAGAVASDAADRAEMDYLKAQIARARARQ